MKASSTSTRKNLSSNAPYRSDAAYSSSLDGDGTDDGSDDARSPFTLEDHDQPSLDEQPTGCDVHGTPTCP